MSNKIVEPCSLKNIQKKKNEMYPSGKRTHLQITDDDTSRHGKYMFANCVLKETKRII